MASIGITQNHVESTSERSVTTYDPYKLLSQKIRTKFDLHKYEDGQKCHRDGTELCCAGGEHLFEVLRELHL